MCLEEMETDMQRRERRGANRYDLRPQMKLSSTGATIPTRVSNRDLNQQASRKKKTDDSQECRSWASLPYDLLLLITNYLTIADFLTLGNVCRDWRKFFLASKQKFMESQPPLVAYMSTRAKKTCCFSNIFSGIRYQTRLPYFARHHCLGVSNGYFIMQNFDNSIWISNPVTGNNIQFSQIPRPSKRMHVNDKAIIASVESHPHHFLIVVLSCMHSNLQFCISEENRWRHYSFDKRPWFITDIVVFQGKVYAITSDYQVGILNLRSCGLRFLKLKHTDRLKSYPRFAASSDRLLIVAFDISFRIKVYSIDFIRKEWIQLQNLGGECLFLSYKTSAKLCKTTERGGRSNCVYMVPFNINSCVVFSVNGGMVEQLPIFPEDASLKMNCWYFLHQSQSMDVVRHRIYEVNPRNNYHLRSQMKPSSFSGID